MLKILLFLSFCCSLSFAYFIVDDNYAKQAQVLNSLDIDMSFFQDSVFVSMQEDIGRYRTKQFLKVLENGEQFAPALKSMIQEAGIPDAFLYLAMAESGFSTNAFSRAKASGLWQFMAPTAKKYGLKIDEYVDERRDPIKSTAAAITYLQALHDRFGKWYLAAMAYNCGEGRVARAIEQAGTDSLNTLLDENAKYLPLETRNYIRKIVIMAHFSEDANFLVGNGADHYLNSGNAEQTFAQVAIKGGMSLADVADAINMSLIEVLNYNPHLNYFFTPPNQEMYHIYIPSDKQAKYESDFDKNTVASKFYIYTVEQGDSFYKIAKKYNVGYKIIKDFNKIKSDYVKPGQKLVIPTVIKMPENIKYYTIQNGDTLFSISTKYKLSVAQLMQANNLQDSNIRPGNKLEIPSASY